MFTVFCTIGITALLILFCNNWVSCKYSVLSFCCIRFSCLRVRNRLKHPHSATISSAFLAQFISPNFVNRMSYSSRSIIKVILYLNFVIVTLLVSLKMVFCECLKSSIVTITRKITIICIVGILQRQKVSINLGPLYVYLFNLSNFK